MVQLLSLVCVGLSLFLSSSSPFNLLIWTIVRILIRERRVIPWEKVNLRVRCSYNSGILHTTQCASCRFDRCILRCEPQNPYNTEACKRRGRLRSVIFCSRLHRILRYSRYSLFAFERQGAFSVSFTAANFDAEKARMKGMRKRRRRSRTAR